jgi:hypothetical protein
LERGVRIEEVPIREFHFLTLMFRKD